MSYGDDADLLHDRGTRVEASKRWHEQNQLRHDYNYRSPPRSSNRSYNKTSYKSRNSYKTSSYKPKSTYKPKQKYNILKLIKCSNCGRQYETNKYAECPYCSKSKLTTLDPDLMKTCPYCGKPYNKNIYESCPFCYMSNKIICSNCGMKYNKFKYKKCPNCDKDPKEKDTKKDIISNTSAIIGFCIVVSILFVILLMLIYGFI